MLEDRISGFTSRLVEREPLDISLICKEALKLLRDLRFGHCESVSHQTVNGNIQVFDKCGDFFPGDHVSQYSVYFFFNENALKSPLHVLSKELLLPAMSFLEHSIPKSWVFVVPSRLENPEGVKASIVERLDNIELRTILTKHPIDSRDGTTAPAYPVEDIAVTIESWYNITLDELQHDVPTAPVLCFTTRARAPEQIHD